jgi:hypothetical protein
LQFKQGDIAKRTYPRSFCQLEFTQACDFVDLHPVNFVSLTTDFGFFPSECLSLEIFVFMAVTLPSFKIFSVKNMI